MANKKKRTDTEQADQKPTAREEQLIAIAADAERRYAHVQQLLTSFLGNMPALSFIKDDQGRYLYASRSFAEFFEVKPEEFLGKADNEWLPPDVAKQFMDNDEQVRRSGKSIEVIERVPKNGEIIESIVQKFPVWPGHDTSDGLPFVGGIAVDITERQRSQQRITDLAEEMENLAYTVSHELQEPVNTIKSYQNLLAVRYKERMGPDADSFIAKCSEAATTIGKMVADLWTLARVAKQLDFGNVDTTRALGAALERLAPLIDEKGAGLAYGDLPKVHAVEKQVIDLFEQLIKNALQHCDQRPSIQIDTSSREAFEEFRISDNGRGIDPMEAKDMFKLYKRAGSQRPDASGAGMGLPICVRIVQHHGGDIRIETNPNAGTTVIFTLPRAKLKR